MNENFIDYYKILDVDIEATSSEIRNNYLKLAKKNHPDQGGSSEMFQLICKGYECLYNKETRKEYDLIYLKRSFDELKEDELIKFKDEFNEFVSTNVKSMNEEKINELFSEIFKDTEEIKNQKLNNIDLEKRITDICLERETQDIETKDDVIKTLLDNEQELNINDVYEFTKQKYGYENTNIINNEIGTADLLQFDKYGSYELLKNDDNYVSNIYTDINNLNNNNIKEIANKISYSDIKEWKNTKKQDKKLTSNEIEDYIKIRRSEENILLNDVEKNFRDNKKKKEINSFVKNEFDEELEEVEKIDNIKKRN